MQMKKKLFIVLCSALFVTLAVSASAALGTKSLSWYFKPTLDGGRTMPPGEAPFIGEHDGYYIGKDEKKVYLTFDVGYENGNVKKILDTLKKHEVKGAFFILENVINSNPELLSQMAADGHLICNHTLKHKDISKLSDKKALEKEIIGLEELLREKTGIEMAKYFRPPEGNFSEQSLAFTKELGYKTVFWSLAYPDWDNNNQMKPEKALEKLMSRMHNGAVILLHPTSATNAEIMDEFITKLKADGYSFGTLDELCEK